MDSTLSSPLLDTAPAPSSPPHPPPTNIDLLALHAVDSIKHPLSHTQPSTLTSLSNSPFQMAGPSVDDQALLSQQYSELMAQNELLAKENRLFDSFLQRNAAAAIEHAQSPKHGRREKNRQQIELTLSDLDRNRLAVDELAYRTRQLTSLQQKSTADLQLLRSISLNMQLRQQELKKQAFEFQREVVMTTKHQPTPTHNKQQNDTTIDGSPIPIEAGGSGVTSEVLLRFLNEQIKDKQNMIKKLTMKIRHQKQTLHHMHQNLKQKEEQGDSLHSIDFHQLQIKNSQYNSKIKDKNEQLLTLKSGAGIAVNRLNSMKKILSDEMTSNKIIKKSIKIKHEMIEKMINEMDKVELEIKVESVKQNKLKQVQSNPDMPHVMDYVKQKIEYENLMENNSNWDRKLEIVQMTHVPPNSIRMKEQRAQYQRLQLQQAASRRHEMEEKEQLKSLNVAAAGGSGGLGAAGSAMFPTMSMLQQQ